MTSSPETPSPEIKQQINDPDFVSIQVSSGEPLDPNQELINSAFKARTAFKLLGLEYRNSLMSIGDNFAPENRSFSLKPSTPPEEVIALREIINSFLDLSLTLEGAMKFKKAEDLNKDIPHLVFGVAELVDVPLSLQGATRSDSREETVATLKRLIAQRLENLSDKVLSRYQINPDQQESIQITDPEEERFILEEELSGYLHDVTNKYTSIKGQYDLIKRRIDRGVSLEEINLFNSLEAASDLYSLANDADKALIDTLRSGEIEKVDFNTINQTIVEKLIAGLRDSGISLDLGSELVLPPEMLFRWPPALISRIFENMVINSKKSFIDVEDSNPGVNVEKRIGVSFKIEQGRKGPELEITYADNGKGFPEGMREYEDGLSSWDSTRNTGTGRGMAYHVRRLRTINGGRVDLFNVDELGKPIFGYERGAVHIIRVPVYDPLDRG